MFQTHRNSTLQLSTPCVVFKSIITAICFGSIFIFGSICFAQEVRITNISPPAGFVSKIVQHPNDPQLLYAVIGDRVYRTDNGGRFWKATGLRNVTALSVDQSGKRIFAATENWLVPSNRFGFWVSTDKAKTFRIVGHPQYALREIFPHPTLGKVLFAFGCGGWDLCASMDRGSTWEEFKNLPVSEADYDSEYFLSGMQFVQGKQDEVFLSGRLYRNHQRSIPFLANSPDLGKKWNKIQANELHFLEHGNQRFAYGKSGIFEYLGGNWTRISDQSLEQMITTKNSVQRLWGIGKDNVSKIRALLTSKDGGLTWQRIDVPFPDEILLGRANNTNLLIGTRGGGFYSFSNGHWSWTGNGIKDSTLHSISVSNSDQVLYSLGGKFVQTYRVKTRTWKDLSWNLKRRSGEILESIHVDPFNENVLYLVTSQRLLRSIDAGTSWGAVELEGIPLFDAYRQGVIYFVGPGRHLVKSIDSGNSFVRLPLECSQCPGYISRITLDPYDGNVLYFTMPGGIWKSIDGGKTIQKTAKVHSGVLAALPAKNHYLLMTWTGSLFKTTTGGTQWSNLSVLPSERSYLNISKLAVTSNGKMIVAVNGFYELFLSSDAGKSWNRPLRDGAEALDLVVNSDRSFIVSTATGLFMIQIL